MSQASLLLADPSETLRAVDRHIARWRFVPHRSVASGHAQTIAGALWPRRFDPALAAADRVEIEVEPGSRVVALASWLPDRESRPTLLLVHGLEGSSESRYMLGTAGKALAAGWNAVRLNLRNCGDTEHMSATLYNSGMSGDVAAVVGHLVERERVGRLVVAGFSLGANLVLKMAGELGDRAPSALRGIATVSPAIDLSASAAALERRSNLLYQRRFVRSLAARMRRKAALFPGRYDLAPLAGMCTVRDYDDRYVAPLFGYRDAEDYYERATARHVLASIRVPALLLHAADDPFIPFTDRVRREVDANPLARAVVTERGGHVGYVGATAEGEDRFWSENRLLDFARLCAE